MKELPDLEYYKIHEDLKLVNKPFVLFTPTYGFGNIPEQVEDFLALGDNAKLFKGVISSGNRNWGEAYFAQSGKKLSMKHEVPWLHRYEMRGNEEDLRVVSKAILELIQKEKHNEGE